MASVLVSFLLNVCTLYMYSAVFSRVRLKSKKERITAAWTNVYGIRMECFFFLFYTKLFHCFWISFMLHITLMYASMLLFVSLCRRRLIGMCVLLWDSFLFCFTSLKKPLFKRLLISAKKQKQKRIWEGKEEKNYRRQIA